MSVPVSASGAVHRHLPLGGKLPDRGAGCADVVGGEIVLSSGGTYSVTATVRSADTGWDGVVYEIDLEGNLLAEWTTMPEYPRHGGATMACTGQFGYILCILMQADSDMLVFYDLGYGPSPVNDSSWGKIKAMFR